MNKLNNKALIIILLSLTGLFALSKIFRSPRLESNLRKNLLTLDTASITALNILPANAHNQPIRITREANQWVAEKDGKKFSADAATIKGALGTLQKIEPDREISRKKDKWNSYNVGDQSTLVSVYYGNRKQADLHIGKSGYSQGAGSMYGGNAYTYVRLNDEEAVYAVTGYFESMFNQPINHWRDRTFLRIPRNLINAISFRYPADSSFTLQKQDTVWLVDGVPAEKKSVELYLGNLSFKNLTAFADEFVPVTPADVVITIKGASSTLAVIEGWKRESDWVLRGPAQQATFFSSSGSSVEKDLLAGKHRFVKR
jgi:hypothetical protein